MPLTDFQQTVARLRSTNRTEDSHLAGRFLPAVKNEIVGYQLHSLVLAINKVLALAGRDEARDFLDILTIDREVLPLGALCWAAVGNDPGFSPRSLLELLRRRGKYRPEEFKRLHLVREVDVQTLKRQWLDALARAERFVDAQDPDEIGCLFYDKTRGEFVAPIDGTRRATIVPHFGRPGGVLPSIRT